MTESLPIKKSRTAKTKNTGMNFPELSSEQNYFVQKAMEGHNILVDACIGSGKTTSIQYLCNQLPDTTHILYLTYNRLLKIDAKAKIKNKNVTVQNYHGFASWMLYKNDAYAGIADSIQVFLKGQFPIPEYDVLIIDEYQDIELEFAKLLVYIKDHNPGIQIIAVGDMQQKIYDKTNLNASAFIKDFLGSGYVGIDFTKCFRLQDDLASLLGRVWHKEIHGVNSNCRVQIMSRSKATEFLKNKDPQDILCLGARKGEMTIVLNTLEATCPEKFNKKTVYASIREQNGNAAEPNAKSAIFTTFDSSKGMERPICLVFDWTYDYWLSRIRQPNASYKIIRNIFCVAASRGKEDIIFVTNDPDLLLTEDEISKQTDEMEMSGYISIDEMFDFKYKEDIEDTYNLLSINRVDMKPLISKRGKDAATPDANSFDLAIKDHDELIDLTPCINTYMKCAYFTNSSIDDEIRMYETVANQKMFMNDRKEAVLFDLPFDNKVTILVARRTKQDRYVTQVTLPLVDDEARNILFDRLSLLLDRSENTQITSAIPFCNEDGEIQFEAIGHADVIKDNVLYQVRYKDELSHVDYLVAACYMIANNLKAGYVWNIRLNELYEVEIPDKIAFLNAVAITITKEKFLKYYPMAETEN